MRYVYEKDPISAPFPVLNAQPARISSRQSGDDRLIRISQILRRNAICLTGGDEGPLAAALARGGESEARYDHSAGSPLSMAAATSISSYSAISSEKRMPQSVAARARRWAQLPVIATNGVRYAAEKDREPLDLFTAIRHHTTLDDAGRLLATNSMRHLRAACEMKALFYDIPEAIANTRIVSQRLAFTLDNLGYEFPHYPVPEGETMDSFLRACRRRRRQAVRFAGQAASALEGARAGAARARAYLQARLCRLLPHRLGSHPLLPAPGFSGAGARLGGQLSIYRLRGLYWLSLSRLPSCPVGHAIGSYLAEGGVSFPAKSNVRFVQCDLRNGQRVSQLLNEYQPSHVFHLGAQSLPMVSWADPVRTFESNIMGSLNLFEAVRHMGKHPVVVPACSSAEYGYVPPSRIPVTENEPLHPLHPYGISKVWSRIPGVRVFPRLPDLSCQSAVVQYDGTGKNQCMVPPSDFVRQLVRMKKGLQPPVIEVGNLTPRRAFLDVRDTVRGFYLAALKGSAR